MREHADIRNNFADAVETFLALAPNVNLFGSVCRVAVEEVPQDWSLRTGPPLVTVHDDGGPEQWPIKRDATIRITVRARGSDLADRVARRVHGYLHDNRPPGVAHVFRNGGSVFVTARDTDTGADMASFTVPAAVRTIETV
ncbi:hypothetical protein [Mycobacteroides immunogenum]|uniref:Tail terminator n=1 Tax=Mycobacteroides immunogenum TaxID=83262 RepID=A0A7V8LKP2_9MYCO|nr:hypothetical protein [Mycobacteroides immunogenum]AMT72103.1 hypothetical protein ABG82_19220 [Mycobacteroides immunogenum]ANO05234.1 hypothetical protein BAB75_19480 [Mycobacteroides immunogenum]KIU37689.1 hypothetical protein TL11_26410 [Mycobacteroides immunogenum]KPG04253.1 hypothetical protein AN909_23545 [Mycobacteroides immunogenum]KPG04830.1 hypothetical protein AN908_23670 [Mycobacteroides immunogenum]